MELGSEPNLDLHNVKITPHSFFHYIGDTPYCLFDSGRSALKAAARVLGSGTILMPELICRSVLTCFPPDRLVFYRLKEDLQIDACDLLSKINGGTAAVYLMHYFGALQPEKVLSLLRTEKEKLGFTIIEDTTHSIFSGKRTVGDQCVASLRKWFAVPNGGVLYAGAMRPDSYEELPKSTDNDKAYAMMLKTLYLKGRLDGNAEYRRIFAACEERFDTQKEVKRISDFSEFLLGCGDVPAMVRKRKSNLNRLQSDLSRFGIRPICSLKAEDCPFALPLIIRNRDDFRTYLAENRIYCAVHWPFNGLAREERPLAVFLSDHMISLPIDQRYGEEEMTYMANVIGAYPL